MARLEAVSAIGVDKPKVTLEPAGSTAAFFSRSQCTVITPAPIPAPTPCSHRSAHHCANRLAPLPVVIPNSDAVRTGMTLRDDFAFRVGPGVWVPLSASRCRGNDSAYHPAALLPQAAAAWSIGRQSFGLRSHTSPVHAHTSPAGITTANPCGSHPAMSCALNGRTRR